MFVYTAKLSRKKRILLLLLAAVILAVVVLFAFRGGNDSRERGAVCKTNEQRVEYLEAMGWEISDEPVDVQTVTIPLTFEGVYAEYSRLQTEQGFDLARYAGQEVTRYTYAVENHPRSTEFVFADILVCKGRVIAGDVQCIALDGFMHGLAFPEAGV